MPALLYSLGRSLWPRGYALLKPPRKSDRVYLDGLRGLAALLVYVHHHERWAHTTYQFGVLERSFGHNGTRHVTTLSLVRIFLTGGHFAVALFMVISGYALAVGPLQLVYAGEPGLVLDRLASSFFRRWLRLFLPAACTTVVFATVSRVLRMETEQSSGGGLYEELRRFSFPFSNDVSISRNLHLWTIPVEFKASMVVLSVLVAVCRSSARGRISCQIVAIFYFLVVVDGWYAAMSLSGLLLCELDLKFQDGRRSLATQTVYSALLAVALFLAGVPHVPDAKAMRRNPGWYYLSFLKPPSMRDPKWFFLFWSASLVVLAAARIPQARRLLESRACRYLGHVSFGLYLSHGPVLCMLGDGLYAVAGMYGVDETAPARLGVLPLSMRGPLGLEFAFVIPFLVLVPVSLRVAEVTTELVDLPLVRLTHFLYRVTLSGS